MSQFILHDRGLIDAAIVDIDARQVANEARNELAEKHGAKGFKVMMAAQDGPSGTDVAAVTFLKFDNKAPNGFVTVGQDTDGSVLTLPDLRTDKGVEVAREMGNLPGYSSQLSKAMGFDAKVENGKVSYGVSSVEEVGRQIIVKTSREPSAGVDVEPITPQDYAEMKQSVQRAQQMSRSGAPSPFGAK